MLRVRAVDSEDVHRVGGSGQGGESNLQRIRELFTASVRPLTVENLADVARRCSVVPGELDVAHSALAYQRTEDTHR